MTPNWKGARCKGCGRKVIFAVDAVDPTKTQILDAVAPVYAVQGEKCIRVRDAHVSHFVTCPERERFSKKKGAQKDGGS
jgi:CRISPR/Cas system-associated exonuclease Cas4 (RecB family)